MRATSPVTSHITTMAASNQGNPVHRAFTTLGPSNKSLSSPDMAAAIVMPTTMPTTPPSRPLTHWFQARGRAPTYWSGVSQAPPRISSKVNQQTRASTTDSAADIPTHTMRAATVAATATSSPAQATRPRRL